MKILLIDDDLLLLDAHRRRLEKAGYDVVVAQNGKEGFKKAKEIKPDIVVTDIVMPKEDGYYVIENIRKNPELAKVPIVAISALQSDSDRNEAMRLGANAFFIKTELSPTQLVQKIEALLNTIK